LKKACVDWLECNWMELNALEVTPLKNLFISADINEPLTLVDALTAVTFAFNGSESSDYVGVKIDKHGIVILTDTGIKKYNDTNMKLP